MIAEFGHFAEAFDLPFAGGSFLNDSAEFQDVALHDLNGAYITTLFPTVRAEPFRQDKTLIQLKQRAAVKSGHEAHLKARLADIAASRVANREHNKIIFDLTKDDRQRTANTAQEARSANAARSLATHGAAADEAISRITPVADATEGDDLDF